MTAYRERTSKYRNTRTEYGGRKFDSKFEAGVARDLDIRKRRLHRICPLHRRHEPSHRCMARVVHERVGL